MDRYLGDVRFLEQFVTQLVRHCFEFRVGETVPRQRIDAAEHITEFVIDFRRACTLRQIRHNRVHLAAQIVEDRPHHFVAFLEVRVDQRDASA